ncbi:DUF397 domain-containing protein [Actinosynnema sp. NPDC020468]|uniref:DUF397 domain-containing protein n=1 Tax=Actinosynnema sp. NPDC020468 TaxID=3154488 RepID=UPI0033CD6DBE
MSTQATARPGVRWRTSSYTNGGQDAECVEAGIPSAGDYRLVRDTKNREGDELKLTTRAFVRFVESLKGSE